MNTRTSTLMEHKLIELRKNNFFLTIIFFFKEKHESELYVAFMQKQKKTRAQPNYSQ